MGADDLDLIRRAMVRAVPMRAACRGHVRLFCPHVLGTTDGDWRLLAWQFAGGSARGLPQDGDWRCFALADLSGLAIVEGPWRRGWSRRRTEQSCVETIDTLVATSLQALPGRPIRQGEGRWPGPV
ncbi:hypothetical protein [Marinivivus vitaminiproducens]|uniref:hypothetical protein n=1 Tax=Marinivivus vitaminiproducens TaxID=3035935 RepID=UPI0027A01880|nr:hypothetical protein P4R82_03040 [Geminicoccaceae bacterium SCSIO 64248]